MSIDTGKFTIIASSRKRETARALEDTRLLGQCMEAKRKRSREATLARMMQSSRAR